MVLETGGVATGKLCNLYSHLYLETVFPALKLIQNCYPYKHFVLKTGNLIEKSASALLRHRTYERLSSPFDKIWTSKIPNSQIFPKLGKIWKRRLVFSKVLILHYLYELGRFWKQTQPNILKSKFWIWGWIGKSYILI